MDFILDQLTGPTNPDDFVGRSLIIDQFHDLLMEFIRSNPTIRWIHISGVAGTGKSSLLRKFRMMTELERVATGSVEVPISPKKAGNFLTDIKQVIEEMSPEWRNRFQRFRNKQISRVYEPPEANDQVASNEALNKLVSEFFSDLDEIDRSMKNTKEQLGLFFDDLDKLLNLGYTSLLSIFPMIAKELIERDYSIIIVTSGHYQANRYLGIDRADSSNYVLHITLNQFDFNEAELMVRRRGKLVKSERELVVQASTRFPFDLALRQFILSKGLDPTTLDAAIITKSFGLNEEEVNLLQDLSKNELNFFSLEETTRLHSSAIVDSFSNSLLFIKSQDGYFAIDSNSLWELISHVFKPIDPRTEVILILSRLKYLAELGQMPSSRELSVIADHFKNIKDNALLFELSGQLAEAAKAALEGGLTITAWDLLHLTTLGLERTKDFEKIADLQETLAKGFAKVNHNYFAAKSFEKAGEYFRKAGIDWRSVTNFREAGQKYHREAEDTDGAIYHYAIRSMLHHSYLAYMNANEPSRARKILQDAQDLLQDFEHHVSYFKKFEKIGE